MKKLLLSCVAVLGLGFISTAVAAPAYQSKIESIPAALNKTNFASFARDGYSTVISVINYSNNEVLVDQPSGHVLTGRTSDRILNPDYDGQTYIVLKDNATQATFFANYVPRYAVVSVYVSNQQYVVYVTE